MPPIPFPTSAPNVPILGQQILVEGYTITTATRCQCEPGGTPVLLTLTFGPLGLQSAPSACGRCRTGYGVQGFQMDAHGALLFQIAVLSASPPALA